MAAYFTTNINRIVQRSRRPGPYVDVVLKSRYQAYLALGLAAADVVTREDILCDRVGFALWAWRQAVPPTMSPGYVAWKDPIDTVQLLCSWDGSLTAELEVRVPPPVLPRGWQAGRADLDDPSGARVILGRATLRMRMDEQAVPAPGVDADIEEILVAAKRVVGQTCRSMNDVAREPLADLAQLWTSPPRQQPPVPRFEHRGAPLR